MQEKDNRRHAMLNSLPLPSKSQLSSPPLNVVVIEVSVVVVVAGEASPMVGMVSQEMTIYLNVNIVAIFDIQKIPFGTYMVVLKSFRVLSMVLFLGGVVVLLFASLVAADPMLIL